MAIPKIIHYCWFGGAELPEDVQKCIESWKMYCPDYKIIRWDETNFDYNKYRYTKEAYEHKKWAFVSDVARLDIVYHYGGIYLDTDVELVKSLDALLDEPAFMGFERGRKVATGLGFGAEKGNSVIKANLEAYENMLVLLEDGKLNMPSCPRVTTACLEELGLFREDRYQKLENVVVYPSEYFCPMLLEDGSAETTENTVSIHHYFATWTTEARRKKEALRRKVYTRYGKKGLSILDGFYLLKEQGPSAFFKRLTEKMKGQ